MADRPILSYVTPPNRFWARRRRLHLIYVFAGLNLLLGFWLLRESAYGVQYGRWDETCVLWSMAGIALGSGAAQLLHRRLQWSVVLGLQLTTMALPATLVVLLFSGSASGEFEHLAPPLIAILLVWSLAPLVYLTRPRVRAGCGRSSC